MTSKTIGHLVYATSSFVHHFVAIGEFTNLSYSPETPNLGQIARFLESCDLEIWRMTVKNNRAPLLSNIKLYASFHHHMWIQTWVTVWKWLSWVVTSVTLTFDLWPWPFAWTLLWSLVITPENFMMIRWWEHSQQGKSEGFDSCDRPSNLTQIGFKSSIFHPCDFEIWWMTQKNNKARLLYNIKRCVSFHIHQWIQTGVSPEKPNLGQIRRFF